MKIYGASSEGRFIFEKVPTLPVWTMYDISRIVLAEDEDVFYLGTSTRWVGFAGNKSIKSYQLDLGTGLQQINAAILPIKNTENIFNDDDNVENVLVEIAKGNYLQKNCLKSEHFNNRIILSPFLKYGFDTNEISSKNIPHYDIENKQNTNIKNYLDYLTNTRPKIINHEVSIDDWEFNSIDQVFVYSFLYTPIQNIKPIVQIYDKTGNQFLPLKINIDSSLNKIKIYLSYRTELIVSIIG